MDDNFIDFPAEDDEVPYERIEPGRILVVDNNPEHSHISATVLTEVGGHEVQETSSPDKALQIARDWHPDVILIDILMPEMNGLKLATLLRQVDKNIDLMFVTSKDSSSDRINGMHIGDQYLTKPFNRRVLLELVDSLLRRRRRIQGDSFADNDIIYDFPILDPNSHTVRLAPNRTVKLSPQLWELAHTLYEAKGEVVSKAQLLRDLWNAEDGDPNLVQVTINRLRNRIELDPAHPEIIIMKKGGYYFNLKRQQR